MKQSPFIATVFRNGYHIEDRASVQWGVFESGNVTISIDAQGSGATTRGYEFRLEPNPNKTGFYVAPTIAECYPGAEGAEESDWSTDSRQIIKLVRCRLGDANNTGFAVVARRTGTRERIVAERADKRPIQQAWHQDGGQALYHRDLYYPDGTKPSYVGLGNYKPNVFNDSIDLAAEVINRVSFGEAIREASSESSANVTVRAYWTTQNRCRTTRDAYGCFGLGGHYPHIAPETLWIAVPPDESFIWKGKEHVTEWTEDESDFSDQLGKRKYFFLPNILAHEFGHSLGLKHLPTLYLNIMSDDTKTKGWPGPKSSPGPSRSDMVGFQQVTKDH